MTSEESHILLMSRTPTPAAPMKLQLHFSPRDVKLIFLCIWKQSKNLTSVCEKFLAALCSFTGIIFSIQLLINSVINAAGDYSDLNSTVSRVINRHVSKVFHCARIWRWSMGIRSLLWSQIHFGRMSALWRGSSEAVTVNKCTWSG